MNDLAARKRLLIAKADLHRSLIGLECQQLRGRWDSASDLVQGKRWWLVGGACVVGGLLLTRPGRGLIRWLPTVIATWRSVKTLKSG